MAFEFRDVQLASEEHDDQFKKDKLVAPCVTCSVSGELAGSEGEPLSATVEDEPDRLWAMSYGDSIPFAVLNDNKVASQTGLAILVGYLEDSSEREIIGYNNETLGLDASTGYLAPGADSGNTNIFRDSLATLRVTAGASGVTVNVSGMEYDRFGHREPSLATIYSLAGLVPAAGKICWALVYLDQVTGTIQGVVGISVEDLAGATILKPDTPVDGYSAAYVKLTGGMTGMTANELEDARRVLRPNLLPGVIYNRVVTSMVIPENYTLLRGIVQIEPGQAIKLEDGARMVLI